MAATAKNGRRKSASNGRKSARKNNRRTTKRASGSSRKKQSTRRGGTARGDTRTRGNGATATLEAESSGDKYASKYGSHGGYTEMQTPGGLIRTYEDGFKVGIVAQNPAQWGNALLKNGKLPQDGDFAQDGSALVVDGSVSEAAFKGTKYANGMGNSAYKHLRDAKMLEELRPASKRKDPSGRAIARVLVDAFEPATERLRGGRRGGTARSSKGPRKPDQMVRVGSKGRRGTAAANGNIGLGEKFRQLMLTENDAPYVFDLLLKALQNEQERKLVQQTLRDYEAIKSAAIGGLPVAS